MIKSYGNGTTLRIGGRRKEGKDLHNTYHWKDNSIVLPKFLVFLNSQHLNNFGCLVSHLGTQFVHTGGCSPLPHLGMKKRKQKRKFWSEDISRKFTHPWKFLVIFRPYNWGWLALLLAVENWECERQAGTALASTTPIGGGDLRNTIIPASSRLGFSSSQTWKMKKRRARSLALVFGCTKRRFIRQPADH
jgi:hypothetical protein